MDISRDFHVTETYGHIIVTSFSCMFMLVVVILHSQIKTETGNLPRECLFFNHLEKVILSKWQKELYSCLLHF